MDKIKKIIIIIIILLLLLLTILIVLKSGITENNEVKQQDVVEDNLSMILLRDNSVFYTISGKINEYLTNVYSKNNSVLYNQLDKKFIEEKNITNSNIQSYIEKYDNMQIFSMQKAYYITKNKINVYAVIGKIKSETLNDSVEEKDYTIVVKLDRNNMTYSIYPYKFDSINDINTNELLNMATTIDKNNNNAFTDARTNIPQITKGYFLEYKSYMLTDPQKAYNLLDKDYREKRFGSLDSYKQYIEDYKNNIPKLSIQKYTLNVYDKYNEYVCIDNYGNYYIFRETSPTQFSILLDSYTIKLQEAKNKYETSTDEEKSAMNVQQFIEMINTKDYSSAYNVLASGFKKNYFKEESTFKKFIKSNFFEFNKVGSISVEKKDNYYVAKVTLQDYLDTSKEMKPINFVINLKENMEFELSFGSN